MATDEVNIKAWEQAEIKRSGVQAARTTAPVFRDSDANIQRYLAPTADTCYPLEYAFHLLGDARGKAVLELVASSKW